MIHFPGRAMHFNTRLIAVKRINRAFTFLLISYHLTVQLTHTPPPRYFPRISIDILLSATSWSYMQDVAWPLQLHFSQWKPLPAVPGFHGIWLYMGQHFSHLSPHVWRSHSHSWCWGITRNVLIRCHEISVFLSYAYLLSYMANTRDLLQICCRYAAGGVCQLRCNICVILIILEEMFVEVCLSQT